MRLLLSPTISLLLLAGCAGRVLYPGEQREVLQPDAAGYPYLMFVPKQKAPSHKGRPLLIFLHGSGERGSDMSLVKVHGPPKIVQTRTDFPFVTVSPQLEEEGDWDVVRLEAMLTQVRRRTHIDATRIYLTGLSRGGHATWRWAVERPTLFAAIIPVAGRGEVAQACRLKDVPVWAFHGDKDGVVEPEGSSKMVEAINACDGQARMTMYDNTGHDSWTRTYDDPATYAWLLAQHKRHPVRLRPIHPRASTRRN